MLLLLLRQSAPVTPPRTYPLAGVAQGYPGTTAQAYPMTAAQSYPMTDAQAYPLAGVQQTYPLQ